MFVLSMNNGKNTGTYLEIGAGDYKYGNNTYLLEKEFYWIGISIDFHENVVNNFNKNRQNKCLCVDATKIDYIKLLNENYIRTEPGRNMARPLMQEMKNYVEMIN